MGKISINISTGSLQEEEMIVGIDLGTTNSLVAIIHPGSRQPVALREHDSSSLVPSIVYFGSDGKPIVGEAARDFLIREPQNTIFSVKRLMGKSFNDIRERSSFFMYKVFEDDTERLVKVQVGDKFYSPIELSSFILRELKSRAEHILKTPVTKAVITVPAYFNDAQRQATRDAGKLAGLDVLRILNEPTAASLAYGLGLNKEDEKTIAVYDLGGGTFDISILRITDGIFEVLSTNGDTYLGGDDFDGAILEFWETKYAWLRAKKDDSSFRQSLRLAAEEAKKTLSGELSYQKELDGGKLEISRDEFNLLILSLVELTIRCCRDALSDASLGREDIDEVVMVGGSTRIPLVQNTVKKFFDRELHNKLNPDEVVALGAAVQADILAGKNKDFLLLDITPLSLGVETMGGLMDVLIPRNSKIPSKIARQYTTQKDGQGSMRISVFQGERDLVRDNRKLAEFNLTGIPGMPAGLPKVEISFLIDADGILVVKARELRSGVEQQIEVRPQYGLTDQEVETMLLDSLTHAQDDIKIRSLIETQTEAQQLIETTEGFLAKNTERLSMAEIEQTNRLVAGLREIISSSDKDAIQHSLEALNEFTRPFAERIMDMAVSAAMKGRKI